MKTMMLVNYVLFSLAWIIYGYETESVAVLASNVLGFFISLTLIILKYRYDQQATQ